MYFIMEGEVDVKHNDWHITLGVGDFFGEIALIKDIPRTATVTVKNRCEVLKLTTYDFKKTLLSHPEILENIITVAEKRMSKVQH
jgi:CRP-like cAMP-binding protein